MKPLEELRDALSSGADPNEGMALVEAIRESSLLVIQALIDAGADLEAKDYLGVPLHFAAGRGRTDAVRALIRAGASVEARNYADATPLHLGTILNRDEVVRALLEAGADIEAQDVRKTTPLLFAAASKHCAAVRKVLIEAGANIEAQDRGGMAPLHWAAQWGGEDSVRDLLEVGADAGALDGVGRTPIQVAMKGPTKALLRAHERRLVIASRRAQTASEVPQPKEPRRRILAEQST
jgi:ankyrin repeat protein